MVVVLIEAKFIFNKIDFNSRLVGNIVLLISLTFYWNFCLFTLLIDVKKH